MVLPVVMLVLRVMLVVVVRTVVVAMPLVMLMVMLVRVAGLTMHIGTIDRRQVRAATTRRAHHAISMSFTRISTPATIPPQSQRPNASTTAVAMLSSCISADPW
jgi:hypothetical protein